MVDRLLNTENQFYDRAVTLRGLFVHPLRQNNGILVVCCTCAACSHISCCVYLDDNVAANHAQYHTTCPESEQDNVAMYYTNDVLRFLPIFEMVISRCIELGQGDILQRVLQRYPMYALAHIWLVAIRALLWLTL